MKKLSFYRAERREPAGERSQSASFVSVLTIVILAALLLSACGSSATPTALPTISLDNNNSSSGTPSGDANSVAASAFIVPLQKAELSFANVGRVKAVDVKVGDQVSAGQTLVELDTTLLEAKVKEAEANLTAAQVQVNYLKRVGT